MAAARESAHRSACADHLRQINAALHVYASLNHNAFPRVVYDERQRNAWTSFTGADCDDPFLDGATVRPNDVTASLWLLVRQQHLSPSVFICPSTSDVADPLLDVRDQKVDPERRGNFRGPENLSYSYASPFSSAPDYRLDDTRPGEFVIVADRNPGKAHGQNVEAVREKDSPLRLALGNSLNHRRAGQNVLYASGVVEFESTPFCGVGRSAKSTGDNIYTALSRAPLDGQHVPANETGVVGEDVGAAWANDTYLVPYER